MKVEAIFKDVSGRLQDLKEPRRWKWTSTEPSLLNYLNMALIEIANQRPDSTAKTEKVKLQSGYRQTLPVGAQSLINIPFAYRVDGSMGSVVSQVKLTELQAVVNSVQPSLEIDSYAYNKLDDPRVFYTSPAVHIVGDAHVEMSYSAAPVTVTAASDDFPMPDQYAPAAVNWMLYAIYSGDNEDTDMVRADFHHKAFYQSLGIKIQVDKLFPVKPKEGAL